MAWRKIFRHSASGKKRETEDSRIPTGHLVLSCEGLFMQACVSPVVLPSRLVGRSVDFQANGA